LTLQVESGFFPHRRDLKGLGMRLTFASVDELLIEQVFQPVCDLLAGRFGVARSSAAGFCLDLASLGWIAARAPRLSSDVVNWDTGPAMMHAVILLAGLTALTALRALFRRQVGCRQGNPLRHIMRPHRAILLVLLLVRMAQTRGPGIAGFADIAMMIAAIAALYLGACAERPPVYSSLFAPSPAA
jgi:hypothetical protein